MNWLSFCDFVKDFWTVFPSVFAVFALRDFASSILVLAPIPESIDTSESLRSGSLAQIVHNLPCRWFLPLSLHKSSIFSSSMASIFQIPIFVQTQRLYPLANPPMIPRFPRRRIRLRPRIFNWDPLFSKDALLF